MQGKIRFIPYSTFDPALNMALDQVLFAGDEMVLRLYGWASPTLSLGKSQKQITDIDLELAKSRGISLVRRATGGQAVLHDQELTYSFCASSPPMAKKILDSYQQIAEPLTLALKALGLEVELAGEAKFKPESSHCFLEASPYEIMVRGKKLIGSAQKRSRGRLLQHGSLPLSIDRELWSSLWPSDDGSRYLSLSEALGRQVTMQELMEPIKTSFAHSFGLELVEQDFTAEELAQAKALRANHQME